VTQLWKNSNTNYDIIISLRPDVLYINPIKITDLNKINDNIIVLSNFAEHPINDRFAMGNYDVMQIHGERFINAYNYSLSHPLEAEKYLIYILKNNNIKIIKIDFIFLRLRLNKTSPDLQNLYDINNNQKTLTLLLILIMLFIFIPTNKII
jgi:hypothetical protein